MDVVIVLAVFVTILGVWAFLDCPWGQRCPHGHDLDWCGECQVKARGDD